MDYGTSFHISSSVEKARPVCAMESREGRDLSILHQHPSLPVQGWDVLGDQAALPPC